MATKPQIGIWLLVFAVASAACVETTPLSPDANTLVVHAVLDPGVQHQIIVVQTTTGAVAEQRQVTGAIVTIATPDGRTLTAVERRDTTAVTRGGTDLPFPAVTTIYDVDAGSAGLIPGSTYQLRVVAPDGRTVTGQTTIPNAIPFTTTPPAMTIDLERDTVRLQWARVPGARGYHVFLRSTDLRDSPAARNEGTYSLFADTSVVLPGTVKGLEAGWYTFGPGRTHQLAVIAVDQNYFDYYHRTSDGLTATAGLIMHLNGGIGVFGSAVVVAARTIVANP